MNPDWFSLVMRFSGWCQCCHKPIVAGLRVMANATASTSGKWAFRHKECHDKVSVTELIAISRERSSSKECDLDELGRLLDESRDFDAALLKGKVIDLKKAANEAVASEFFGGVTRARSRLTIKSEAPPAPAPSKEPSAIEKLQVGAKWRFN